MVTAAMKLKDTLWKKSYEQLRQHFKNKEKETTKHCGNSGNSVRLFWGGSKITVDGDCSHEIKRCLLLERKVMTNLDSIFKSRDSTLPTKVRLVKAMVFPVVTLDMKVGL